MKKLLQENVFVSLHLLTTYLLGMLNTIDAVLLNTTKKKKNHINLKALQLVSEKLPLSIICFYSCLTLGWLRLLVTSLSQGNIEKQEMQTCTHTYGKFRVAI